MHLAGKTIAIVATDYFEEVELTSRKPADLPAFNRALVKVLSAV